MARANSNGVSTIYGKDVLEKAKSCQFHFRQTIEQQIKGFDKEKD